MTLAIDARSCPAPWETVRLPMVHMCRRVRRAAPPLTLLAGLLLACSDDPGGTTGTATGPGGQAGAAGAGAAGGSGGAFDPVVIEPMVSNEIFANPGMGWQTFHQFADTDPHLAGLPSGSAYVRWTWRDLEPEDGAIRLDVVSTALERARAAGQTLMFRVMTAGSDSEYAPDWLASSGCAILSYSCDGGEQVHAPDLDDAACRARHDTLIETLGAEFGDEPDLEVDIGSVGLWGEWHFSGTTPAIEMPTLETRRSIVDLYQAAFPNQPKAALIGDVDILAYATAQGSGWRADCLGDMGFFSPDWNHMDHMYQQHVAEAGAEEAWRSGPVAWESCHTMQQWVDAGYDAHEIFQYALDMHGSFVNNKSAALPEGDSHRQEVEWLLGTLGYRLVLRQISYPSVATRGGSLPVAMRWANIGVAPPYHALELALRLVPSSPSADPIVLPVVADLSGWVGDDIEVTDTLGLASDTPTGSYSLAVGVLGTPGIPMVHLGIEGRDADGWYPLGDLTVE